MFVETFAEFCERQGCEHRFIAGRELFANGAQHTGQEFDGGIAPPSDRWELLALQKEFVAHKLDAEEKAWHKYKAACLEQASLAAKYSNIPSAPHDAPQRLERGANRIKKLRLELETINRQLAGSPNASLQRARQRQRMEIQRQRSEVLQDLMSVDI